ncbi:hypothetical protein BJV77DRAFT_751204 [Russula vinacea]|nr:hypothetical protein BJV77DRAFT_751204 [Russula vinacea]
MSPVVDTTDGRIAVPLVGTETAGSTQGGKSTTTLSPVTSGILPASKSQSSTDSAASSQTSPSAPSSGVLPLARLPLTRLRRVLPLLPQSPPRLQPFGHAPPSSTPIVVTTPSDTPTTTFITSVQPFQASQAPTPPPRQSSSSTGAVTFFHNRTAMVAVFTTAGLFVLWLSSFWGRSCYAGVGAEPTPKP